MVTFRVDVTNTGSAANQNAVPIQSPDVWDVLPVDITCADISAISDGGQCTDPGDGGQPTFDGNDTRSAIRWQLAATPQLAPGATRTLTYAMTIPTDTSVSKFFVNTAAVASYDTATNLPGVTAEHHPQDNIDNTIDEAEWDVPAASDDSEVHTRSVTITKSNVTDITEQNNGINQAVVGETLTYTVQLRVPPRTTIYNGEMTDPMPPGIDFLSASAAYSASNTSPATAPLPPGFTLDQANQALVFPAVWPNNTDTPQLFEVKFQARVSTLASNTHNVARVNTARFTSDTALVGGQAIPPQTATSTVTVVAPQASITKGDDDADNIVSAGQTVTYTLRLVGATGRPPSHDVWVVDCLPNGMNFGAFVTPITGTATSQPGTGSNGCATGTRRIAWNVPTVSQGPFELQYTATVSTTAAAGATYTNVATATGPPGDLDGRAAHDVYGAALAHWTLLGQRSPGTTKIRVYNPRFEEDGWQSTHTVIEIVIDNMPFLVDSVTMELNRLGYGIHLMLHPVVYLNRDADGKTVEVLSADARHDGALAESVIHVEVDRETEAADLEALRASLVKVLDEVRAASEDWPKMRERAHALIAELDESPPPVDPREVEETKALLAWLDDHHFTFLGYREYELVADGDDSRLLALEDTGLGILRSAPKQGLSGAFAKLPPRVKARARAHNRLLQLTKSTSRSRVHRPSYLDYIGVNRFGPSGEIVGERRFLGLYTTGAYKARPTGIPILRSKVAVVLERAGFPPGGHNEKALIELLETYPRDELFQVHTEELFETAMAILGVGERARVRLFVRRDDFERFLSCLVFLPRDRFNTENRERVQQILQEAFSAESIDFSLRLSESVNVRIHYTVRTPQGELPDYDVDAIEARIVEATHSWTEDLKDALVDEVGEEHGNDWFRHYGGAFPTAYRADWDAQSAVADIRRIEGLPVTDGLAMRLYEPDDRSRGQLRCKLLRAGAPLQLSDVLPMFENMGLKVTDERPYEVTPPGTSSIWIFDFGLLHGAEQELRVDQIRDAFQDAFARISRGEVENDGFNALVLAAGLTWREITIVRAIAGYLRQLGTTFSNRYMEQTLVAYPEIARKLVRALPRALRPGAPPRPGDPRSHRAGDRSRDRRGREPGRGPHPAQLPHRHPRHPAHELLPARRRGRPQGLPVVQARSRRASRWRPCRDRGSRSSSARHAPRASTCVADTSPAADCAGRTGARTTAPRSSG